ncbi:hypothetical protein LTR01_001718 [Friedmanniomyces endolithicus]|nr:hypothetical protein LTR01_001718 [Friedmanniomyces endolithicus]KAK0830252.1 hypothetical protein LTR73_003530 [Friedmanniomyces endolithicus]
MSLAVARHPPALRDCNVTIKGWGSGAGHVVYGGAPGSCGDLNQAGESVGNTAYVKQIQPNLRLLEFSLGTDTATAAPAPKQHHLTSSSEPKTSPHILHLTLATLGYRRYAAMDRDEAIMIAYRNGFDEAKAFYMNDQFEEAVEVAESILYDNELPRFHRIKFFLLIAACLADRSEADDIIERADSEWSMARWYVATRGEDADSADSRDALAELRSEIDAVKKHFAEERAAAFAREEREWKEQELAREMEGVEDDDGEVGEEGEVVEKGEQIVPGAMVIESYDQVRYDQQEHGDVTEQKSIASTGTEALHHHPHRPGSVRVEEQASRGSFLPSSLATVLPFRSRKFVLKVKVEASPPTDK